MKSEDSDKKLNRVSIIFELIVNVGTIASWILGLFSAFVLTTQPSPIALPGINFPLSASYQFVLWISALLAYMHFLRRYWEKNQSSQKFSDSFGAYIFRDLLHLKQPLLLTPFILAIAIGIQIAIKGASNNEPLITTLYVIIGAVTFFVVVMSQVIILSDGVSDDKVYEEWNKSERLKERWINRIRKKLEVQESVNTEDFITLPLPPRWADKHINWALEMYFYKFEMEENLSLDSSPAKRIVEDEVLKVRRLTLTRHKAKPQ